ncbi:MAG: succinylglutamate desuccinylase/aspartoacylase family protein [Alphaproteobacteria bacterium]|nr:succinylglutamate desuccinylase/aspartoacylase family protein [Alphaproteobacteria bacterium]
MAHRVETIALMSPGPGSERHLVVHRFGKPGARPKFYFQAALHADELPGSLVLNRMLSWLKEAEEEGGLNGEFVIVPLANPVGLANRILNYHLGRFDLGGDGNFNRWYPDLGAVVVQEVGDLLTDDRQANTPIIRQALLDAVAEWPARGEANQLRKTLLGLSVDSDFVFDLHCHGEGIAYIYFPRDIWPRYSDLAGELGCRTILLHDATEGTAFENAAAVAWSTIRKAFPDHVIADAPFATTLELRGQSDVVADLALDDASALWRFLVRHGFIAGDPVSPPDLLCQPTPLAGSDNLVAPVAGVVSYRLAPGDRVEAGMVVADIVDPAEADWQRARTPVASRASGILYGRRLSRLVRPGQSFAVVSGPEELPPPDHPVHDW